MDMETGQSWFWKEENRFPSEPVFVPRPDGKEEDDGELNVPIYLGLERGVCTFHVSYNF